MSRMTRLLSLLPVCALMTGCSMPEATQTVEGPAFTLTADEPVAAFEVTLCLKGPSPKELYVSSSLFMAATTDAGEPVMLRVESLERPEPEPDARDPYLADVEVGPGEPNERVISLVADAAWKGSGERCAEPEVVQFSVDALPEGASVSVDEWDVTMRVEWNDGMFGNGPDDGDVSVEIEQL